MKKKGSPLFLSPYLHAHELAYAEVVWRQITRRAHFRDEYTSLSRGHPVSSNSQLTSLNPFFDEQTKCLRVGGRLRFSKLGFKEKHPVILPSEARLSQLIVENHHLRALHDGTILTLNVIATRMELFTLENW